MTPRIRLLKGMALLGLLAGGCKQEPSRWDQAHQQTQGQRATTAESKAGGEFNKFFPKVQSPFDVIFKQEKQGYAEVSLQQDGALGPDS